MALVIDLSGNHPQSTEVDKHVGEAPDQVWGGEPVAIQTVVAGAASAQSAPFNVRTSALRLVAKTAGVRYVVGPAPQTALATSTLLPAGGLEQIVVRSGWVVAAIQDVGAAELNVTELG